MKRAKNEEGIVAIVVTMIFLLIISLTVLGLARMARREQQQELDNRLARQSYYVAESGVNDAIRYINGGGGEITSCSDSNKLINNGVALGGANKFDLLSTAPSLDATLLRSKLGDVSAEGTYTCVLIQKAQKSVEFDDIAVDKSSYTKMVIDNNVGPLGAPVAYDILFSWQEKSGTANFQSVSHPFPKSGWGLGAGVLRIDLTNKATLTRAGLGNNTMTAYLYPMDGATGWPTSGTGFSVGNSSGKIIDAQCNVGNNTDPYRHCNAIVQFPAAGPNDFFLRLKSIYRASNVAIRAYAATDVGHTSPLTIKEAQTTIDSTGKVADVVKRIKVRVNNTKTFRYPEYALESVGGICKRLYAGPAIDPKYNKAAPLVNPSADDDLCNPEKP